MSSNPNISVKPEYTEAEVQEKAAAFERRFGSNVSEWVNTPAQPDRELIQQTNEFLERAAARAGQDRAIEEIGRRELQETYAATAGPGEWVPGAQTEARRQELREDWQRRQEWNGLIEGGSVATAAPERSVQDLKPPAELSNQQIVTEARELHAQFAEKLNRWEAMAPGADKNELREEMKPLVLRENELREEYTGRMKTAEVSRDLQDHVPEQGIGFGR